MWIFFWKEHSCTFNKRKEKLKTTKYSWHWMFIFQVQTILLSFFHWLAKSLNSTHGGRSTDLSVVNLFSLTHITGTSFKFLFFFCPEQLQPKVAKVFAVAISGYSQRPNCTCRLYTTDELTRVSFQVITCNISGGYPTPILLSKRTKIRKLHDFERKTMQDRAMWRPVKEDRSFCQLSSLTAASKSFAPE